MARTTRQLRDDLHAMWDDLEARGATIDRTPIQQRRTPTQLRALAAQARERQRVLSSPEAQLTPATRRQRTTP